MNKDREPSRHEHERGAPLVDDCDNWCKGKYSKWSAAREGGGMTIQTYKAIQGGYVPSDDGPVVFKTDYLREIEHYQSDDRGKTNEINILTKENRALTAALAEKERSVHEKYKAELITQNDQLDRYEEQIAALTARIKELEDDIRELMKYATGEVTAQKEGV
jgi:chromosome segregation ATPase